MAFAVAGTGLKTNGHWRGKQSGTKGWAGRWQKKEVEEVGGREEKPSKKDFLEKRVGDDLKRLKMPEVLQTAGLAKVNWDLWSDLLSNVIMTDLWCFTMFSRNRSKAVQVR